MDLERKDQENRLMQKYLDKLCEEEAEKLEKRREEQNNLRVKIKNIVIKVFNIKVRCSLKSVKEYRMLHKTEYFFTGGFKSVQC